MTEPEISINIPEDVIDIPQSDITSKIEINNEELDVFSPIEEEVVLEKEITEPEVRIDIPELADDDFLKELTTKSSIESSQSIEVIELEAIDVETQANLKKLNVPSYDTKLVANEIGLSEENFLELFEDYINESKEISYGISQAIENNDPKMWQYKSLQLKGMSDNMRIKHFTKQLETLTLTQDVKIAKNANTEIFKALLAISNIEG